jgi:acetyl-CoA C-acetyltransferase
MHDESIYIAGAFEHPTRSAPDKSTPQLHAEAAKGAVDDAGIDVAAIDGYFTAMGNEHGELPALVMTDYLGIEPGYVDTTDTGGAAYISFVGHAASAIRAGKCSAALITFGERPRSAADQTGTELQNTTVVQNSFENIYGAGLVSRYAMAARRHMYEYGTTSEQLAAVRVAASKHAQHNEHAVYRDPVTVEEVVDSPTIADPLHLLDCCLISDGAGAVVVVGEDAADEIDRECVQLLGHGETVKHYDAGRVDLTRTGAKESGRQAFREANVTPEDVDYASIYDSFTITVLETIEDLGFCEKGEGGEFVEDGGLEAPDGALPFNTDGGGLCSNHPERGGMLKLVEAVKQLRGEANAPVQVPDAEIALAHGTGGPGIGNRHLSTTVVLGSENA